MQVSVLVSSLSLGARGSDGCSFLRVTACSARHLENVVASGAEGL